MQLRRKFFAVVVASLVASVYAGESAHDTFGKWRISVGGAFNGGVRSRVGVRHSAVLAPASYVIPTGMSEADAKRKAENHDYGAYGYVKKDDMTDYSGTTENWKLLSNQAYDADIDKTSGYKTDSGNFELYNKFEYVVDGASRISYADHDKSSDECQFGVSAEISRELWIHDEPFERRWGVDFAAAFSYFFQRDVFKLHGSATRTDDVGYGYYKTTIDARDTMYSYIEETDPAYKNYPVGGFYGMGSATAVGNPGIIMDNITITGPQKLATAERSSSSSYSAHGDYRELEMLFMLRPWYELTDWWRVYGEIGVGVSYGRFDTHFYGAGISHGEDFKQWDAYGVAGLGTMFRFGMFDVSLDFIGRFLRDDMDVDGRYVDGKVERSDWGARLMVGFEF